VLVVWLWLMGGLFRFLWGLRKTAHKEKHVWSFGLACGMLGALVAFLLTAMVQYNFGDAEMMMVFWLSIGCAFAASWLLQELVTTPIQQRSMDGTQGTGRAVVGRDQVVAC